MPLPPLLLLLAGGALAQLLPPQTNGVTDEPEVNCQSHEVGLRFKTANPFNGHVFVRGHYNDDDCHQDFVLNDAHGGNLNVAFDNMLTPSVLGNDPQPMPDCQYRVLSGGPGGPVISFAKVGDRVYHDWHCIYPSQDMYCMMIHTCTVDDGEASIYEVVDKDGCTRDSTILDELTYTGDLRAGTGSAVFKFADKARVYFTCQVRLSLKLEDNGGVCPRPNCDFAGRRKRRSSSLRSRGDFDIAAPPLLIADIDEPEPSAASHELGSGDWRRGGELESVSVCLSELSFAVLLSIVALIAIVAILTTLVFCLRHRAWKF